MIGGSPRTKAALEGEGVKVFECPGKVFTVKGGGGPVWLIRPLFREYSTIPGWEKLPHLTPGLGEIC